MGMLGMHGTWYSNTAVHYCDLLIAVGARFDDRVTGNTEAFAAEAKKIHIDIDPTAISKNVKVDVPIVGDVKKVLQKLSPLLNRLTRETGFRQSNNGRSSIRSGTGTANSSACSM